MKKFSITIFLLLIGLLSKSQEPKPQRITSNILFIFDASLSMMGQWESEKKITIATRLLINMVDSLDKIPNIKMALRIYGHQTDIMPGLQDCNDTRLEVPFETNNAIRIKQKLKNITPRGTTPIAISLEKCANDFPVCTNCRNIVILITDGIEECRGNPCEVSEQLQKKGIIIRPFIIGIGLEETKKNMFECVGRYFDASNEAQFNSVLGVVITQVLNSTTAQVNLLDSYGKPTETDVNLTFYDMLSGKVKHNFIHTLNNKGNPDTLYLDPLITYRMVVNTIPPVIKDSIKTVPGKHTIVAVEAPQGTLVVSSVDIPQYKNLSFIVRKAGNMTTLNIQEINKKEKYLIGTYNIEILTLPRIYIDNIEIKQSHTTTVEIPKPGIATILVAAPGFGSIYVERNGIQEWVCNLNPNLTQEMFNLQPGNYIVSFRPKNAKTTASTITRQFKIDSGSSVSLRLNY